MTPAKDGFGRFVPAKVAALWADTCYLCREARAAHHVMPDDRLVCPDDHDVTFEPSVTADCLYPARHEVGCDDAAGLC